MKQNFNMRSWRILRLIYRTYRRIRSRLLATLVIPWNMWKVRGKTKYFCIGRNKTGTTSLKKAFQEMGFVVGDQRRAEKLHHKYYFRGVFRPIIRYCRTAQVFQDVPFSAPDTFKHLDIAYPGSKFILTVRSSPDEWYKSITRFHAKSWGKKGRVPTADDLREATYIRRGLPYENHARMYGTPDSDPYNADIMKAHYQAYNYSVVEYFKDRPDDLLVVNVARKEDWQRFLGFIGVESGRDNFPWENKTR